MKKRHCLGNDARKALRLFEKQSDLLDLASDLTGLGASEICMPEIRAAITATAQLFAYTVLREKYSHDR